MNNVIEFLKGKKTYIIAIAIAILGVLQGLEIFVVPEWAWAIIAAVGLGTIRAAVTKVSDVIKQ